MDSDSKPEPIPVEGGSQGEMSSGIQPIHSESQNSREFSNPLQMEIAEQLGYFRGLVESATDGLFVLDEQGRFEYANPMGLEAIKWPKHEVVGHHFLKLIPSDHYLQAMKAWQDAVAGNSGTFELEVLQGDGAKKHLLIGYCPLKLGEQRKYSLSFLDIGSLKIQEHELRRSREHVQHLYHQQGVHLHQLEQQYYSFLENAASIAAIVDEDGVIVYGNPIAERYAGVGAGELAGKTLYDVFGPERGKGYVAMMEQVLAGKRTHFEEELTVRNKRVYLDNRCWPLPTRQGEKRKALFFSSDITETRTTQEALRQSEELFRTIFESSIDSIVIWDRNYRYIYRNQAALTFMRRDRNAAVNVTLDDILGWNPEYLSLWKSRIDRIFQTGRAERVEDKLFYEGQDHYSESVLFSLHDGHGAIFAVGAVYRDVTENRRTVKVLSESEHRFRSLAEAAFEGIVIHDHGVIVDCNQRYADILGYCREELIGKNGLSLIHPEDQKNMHGVRQENYPHSYTVRLIRPNGDIRIVESQGRSVQWEGRQLRVASVRDVTERQKMEQELAQTRQRLQELHRQMYLGSMSAFLAHELNQPLTVMALTLSESLRYCDDTDGGRAMRKIIQNNLRQIQRATDTIQKFRRFFKMASFDTEQIISIEPVVQRVKTSLLDSARQAQIEIVLDSSLKELPDLIFSDLAMEHICMVLMQNAVDAANPKEPNHLVISGCVRSHGIELVFDDDCGGLPEGLCDRIFEPFFTTKAGSLGLGLEIVRRILSACGGSIRVENKQGKGCCFIVQIPFPAR
ncbi:MAG: PAS domain S-box protein [Anaerohalosphaeraceae bacterium]